MPDPRSESASLAGLVLRPRQPFDFRRTLRFILSPPALLNRREFAPLLDYFEDGEYRRVIEIGSQRALVGVQEQRQGSNAVLRVRILSGPLDVAARRQIEALVERQFATTLDLAPFYRLAQSDPVLSRLVLRFRGMRIPQSASIYETLVSAILEQQVNLTFAHQVKKALIETYGKPVECDGHSYGAFPEPAALAITTPRELRRIQISGPKARYIIGISRAVLDGSLDLESLRSFEPSVAYARLLEYKGVGPWTAQYVGLRALGHLDCLPASDLGLQKVIRTVYGLRKQPSITRVERLARKWAGWRSYATFYLWLTYWEDAEWKNGLLAELRSARRRSISRLAAQPATR